MRVRVSVSELRVPLFQLWSCPDILGFRVGGLELLGMPRGLPIGC